MVPDTLGGAVCQNGAYAECIIRNEVDKAQVFGAFILILHEWLTGEKFIPE